jgi:hypothetical protein
MFFSLPGFHSKKGPANPLRHFGIVDPQRFAYRTASFLCNATQMPFNRLFERNLAFTPLTTAFMVLTGGFGTAFSTVCAHDSNLFN